MVGYRPAVYAREGRMLGISQPLDGPVFEKLEDAQNWCIHVMISHYDPRLGMSDAQIEPFKGIGQLLSTRQEGHDKSGTHCRDRACLRRDAGSPCRVHDRSSFPPSPQNRGKSSMWPILCSEGTD